MQETLLAAWRGLAGFEERASLRAWLYRIATNRCLNAAPRPQAPTAGGPVDGRSRPRRPGWPSRCGLTPTPTRCSTGSSIPRPGRRRATRPESRSGWRSRPRCNTCRHASAPRSCCARCSAFRPPKSLRCSTRPRRRSRARCNAPARRSTSACPPEASQRAPMPGSLRERDLVGRFATAVEQGDTKAVISLLTDDAWLTMPPQPYEYQGPLAIAGFIVAERRRPSRREPPARADARQRPARVRLLPARSPRGDRCAPTA